MGSITSRRKAPPTPQPQVIYMPAPYTAPTPTSVSDTQEQSVNETEIRRSSLLSRTRGRFGTVQTTFRGLLGGSNDGSARKTLLGE